MMTLEEQVDVRMLEEAIVKLEARIAELERRLNMNSSNSYKMPFGDKPIHKKCSLRKPSGKKLDGQNEHNEYTRLKKQSVQWIRGLPRKNLMYTRPDQRCRL